MSTTLVLMCSGPTFDNLRKKKLLYFCRKRHDVTAPMLLVNMSHQSFLDQLLFIFCSLSQKWMFEEYHLQYWTAWGKKTPINQFVLRNIQLPVAQNKKYRLKKLQVFGMKIHLRMPLHGALCIFGTLILLLPLQVERRVCIHGGAKKSVQ